MQGNLPTHRSPGALDKPHVLHTQDIHSGGDQVLYGAHHASKDTGDLFEPRTGKDVPHKVTRLAQAAWSLYLLVRKCSKPKAHFYTKK